jgi:hypothetical protein
MSKYSYVNPDFRPSNIERIGHPDYDPMSVQAFDGGAIGLTHTFKENGL